MEHKETETEYPMLRWLDSEIVEVERDGKTLKRCFTDLTTEEQSAILDAVAPSEVKRLCLLMAGAVRGIGDIYGLAFVGVED